MITDTTMETKASPPDRFKVICPEPRGSGRRGQPRPPKTLTASGGGCGVGTQSKVEKQLAVETLLTALLRP